MAPSHQASCRRWRYYLFYSLIRPLRRWWSLPASHTARITITPLFNHVHTRHNKFKVWNSCISRLSVNWPWFEFVTYIIFGRPHMNTNTHLTRVHRPLSSLSSTVQFRVLRVFGDVELVSMCSTAAWATCVCVSSNSCSIRVGYFVSAVLFL